MIYKHISIYTVIEKLYRDYEHQEELDVWDLVEWAAEALDKIGASQQYRRMLAELTISNHIVQLPCDFVHSPAISFEGRPVNLSTGKFAPLDVIVTGSGTVNHINGFVVDQQRFPQTDLADSRDIGVEYYYINDNFIVFSFEKGDVLMEYTAVETDEEGFPMIPDKDSYREAVTNYIQWMMDRQSWRRGELPDKVYAETKDTWRQLCVRARAEANMPNIDKMEALKHQWVRLKPNHNSHSTFFNDLGIRERRKHK